MRSPFLESARHPVWLTMNALSTEGSAPGTFAVLEPMTQTLEKDLIGSVLGGAYRIQTQIDEGGMGMVYEAEHVRLKRPVAVKVMAQHLAQDDNALARFTREAEIVSQLHHPHIVQILDFDTTEDGRPYLVMELLRGRSLDQVMTRNEYLDIGPAVRVAVQTASALAAAHQAGIVHRDLKPGNIFLVDTGDELFAKLLDFGISKGGDTRTTGGRKLTGEFDILGTPEYMAPEQALGKTAAVDARGDQYALAVILYEMLTGRVPFTADDVMELLQRVIRDVPVAPSAFRPDLSAGVDEVILTALRKDPEDRYANMSDFATALEIAAGEALGKSNPALARTSDPTLLRPSLSPAPRRNSGSPGRNSGSPGGARSESQVPTHSSTPPGVEKEREKRSNQRTSWHSKDPVAAVRGLIERARQELGLDNVELAVSCAESALEISESTDLDDVRMIIRENAGLFQRTFERKLGSLSRVIRVAADPISGKRLSPEQAFLLSRLEGGLSIEEAIDLSPLTREQTLGQIVGLVRAGHINLGS